MSIAQLLSKHEGEGCVVRFVAPKPHKSKRALFVTEKALKDITSPASNVCFHGARADCERLLERFVMGQAMRVTMGGPGRGASMSRLDPPPGEVWEMRVTEPKTQFRMFGRFGLRDVFIVTGVENRNILGDKARSGNRRSVAWVNAMNACVAEWDKLFPDTPPLVSDLMSDYFSENCDAV